ncbi:hypothetical protein FRACYDRAFT_247687 [Fragilariopsis cylindrus CCMP1102]|uniref:Uncharacterized protein n=1 Tax=Fragilariopsis cylindrus CCMP1102 TaxID=635003 RepID=A0A1E7EW51_9STRA|nr:hypothetical protein FRACYDRAFT_247687 [Fragilariopsis cylindrus CCMP1102]|eukprot:OEU10077.1 hypothetical protein FRACYDRAFT_247687 [Fragilariopsis cylindrus CCMP1102]
MEGRKEFLLKKAEKVLLRSEFDDGCDRNESLVGIYDFIIEILSSQDESSSLSLNKNVCHYRFIAAGGGKTTTTTKEDRDAAAADTTDKVIDLLNTEANLYRVLWLSCVIIVSITDKKNRTTIDTLQTTIRQLVVGSIIQIIPSLPSLSSSPLSIPVELDDRGILRRCNGNDNCDNSWWALTSQSILQELDGGNNNQSSTTKVKITNIISNETKAVDEHSSGVSITLDVGRADCLLLWREHLGKVKQYLMKVMEEQKEIKRLWSVDDVMMAQTNTKKSRNL